MPLSKDPRAPLPDPIRSLILLAFLSVAPGPSSAAEPGYVGAKVCGECHPTELALWQGSYHDRAMKEPTPETVLGDFGEAEIQAHRVTSRFFQRDGQYVVRTDGPDGRLADFPIRYTFGWYPLQQYLIELPGGRLQALGLAWDSRPKGLGGQRWFHLYPNEKGMDHTNPLHWTAPDQTWNYQCADCHSTDLKKGYDPERRLYETRFAEINVACEACHGPGSRHVDQARTKAPTKDDKAKDPTAPSDPTFGLLVDFKDRDGGQWQTDPATGKPARTVARSAHTQTEVCARCHSRRGRMWEDLAPDATLSQGFRLALLEPDLIFRTVRSRTRSSTTAPSSRAACTARAWCARTATTPIASSGGRRAMRGCVRCHQASRYDTHRPSSPCPRLAWCRLYRLPYRPAAYMVVDSGPITACGSRGPTCRSSSAPPTPAERLP